MSQDTNTELLERASDVIDATEGMSYVPIAIEAYIRTNDLEGLREYLDSLERDLALEHFYANDLIDARDEF